MEARSPLRGCLTGGRHCLRYRSGQAGNRDLRQARPVTTPDPETPLPPDLGVGQADTELATELEAQEADEATGEVDGS